MACGPDSAVYGSRDSLVRRYGADSLERLRAVSEGEAVATARGWVATAPTTAQARIGLVQVLYGLRRYDEALAEVERAQELMSGVGAAGVWKALIQFNRGQLGEAAALLDSTLRQVRDTTAALGGIGDFSIAARILAGGGGRIAAAERLTKRVFRAIPFDSAPGPGNVMLTKSEIERMQIAGMHAELATSAVPSLIREAQAVLRRKSGADSATMRRVATANGTGYVMTYLATGDTTHLAHFLALTDTSNSATWRVADAALSLARGDTARARSRVNATYKSPPPAEFTGEAGMVRSYAWGEVLAELGELQLAQEAFGRLDTLGARLQHPGLLVRSYAKRGEVYQRLGDMTKAVESYDKFIAAWSNADPELQPQVDRVRKARAAAKGEVWPERRR